jgi:hypothetical protein
MRYFEVLYYDGYITRSRKVYAEDEYSAIEKVRNNKGNNVQSVQSVWTRVLHIEPGEDQLVQDAKES